MGTTLLVSYHNADSQNFAGGCFAMALSKSIVVMAGGSGERGGWGRGRGAPSLAGDLQHPSDPTARGGKVAPGTSRRMLSHAHACYRTRKHTHARIRFHLQR